MRMIVRFAKLEGVRFLSHLDLQRALSRGLRRSALPIAYSKGFNPHPLLSLASALPVGMSSLDEYFDVHMDVQITPEAFIEAFNAVMPPDIRALGARCVEEGYPTLSARIAAAVYRIETYGLPERDWDALMDQKLKLPPFMALRRTKSGRSEIDLCRVVRAHGAKREGDKTAFTFETGCLDGALVRPDIIIDALCREVGLAPEAVIRIPQRTALYAQKEGTFVSPMDM